MPDLYRSLTARPARLRALLGGSPHAGTVVIDEVQWAPELLTVVHTVMEEPAQPRFAPLLAVAGADAAALALVRADVDGTVRRASGMLDTGATGLPTMLGRMANALGRDAGEGFIDYARGSAFDYIPMQQLIAQFRAGDLDNLRKAIAGRPVVVGAVLPFTDRHPVPFALAAWESGNTVLPGVLMQAQALRSVLGRGINSPAPV